MNSARSNSRPPLAFVAGLAALLVAHFILGLAHGGTLLPDDADQVIFSQSVEWGYHEQPPLYTWLVWLFFRVFGLNAFAYVLLKTLVLGAIYLALFASARRLLGDSNRAAFAAFAPLLIPTFAWHSFFYLTHTNLACAAAATTLYALLRVVQNGRWRDYILLGVALGFGTLSKYNFALFAIALLTAALTITSFRRCLLNGRMLAAVAIAAVLVTPNVLWLLAHRADLLDALANKTSVHGIGGRAAGLLNLAMNIALILLPIALLWVVFRKSSSRQPFVNTDTHELLRRCFVAVAVCLLAMVIAGTTRLHERWLQPFAIFAPLYVFSSFRGALPPKHLRRLAAVLYISAAACAAVRIAQLFVPASTAAIYPMRMNFAAARQELGALADSNATFIVRDRVLCGNLRYHLKAGRYISALHPLYTPPQTVTSAATVVVWNTSRDPDWPAEFRRFVVERRGAPIPENATTRVFELPGKVRNTRTNRIGYTVLTNTAAAAQ